MAGNKSLYRVQAKIMEIYGKKAAAAYALCRKYALMAQRTAKAKQGLEQGEGYYWINRTSEAAKGLHGFAVQEKQYAGWGLMHTKEYGRWLELANNREHAVLEPTVRELAPAFMEDVGKIYGG